MEQEMVALDGEIEEDQSKIDQFNAETKKLEKDLKSAKKGE